MQKRTRPLRRIVTKKLKEQIEDILRRNNDFRARGGCYHQDFVARESGEVFYRNMTPEDFEKLPVKRKRDGGPAYTYSILSKPYMALYADEPWKSQIAVYLDTRELDRLKIKHSF